VKSWLIGQYSYLLLRTGVPGDGDGNFLMALLTEPEAAHTFCHGLADYARRIFDRYLDLGVDGIHFSEDLGTQRALMISPALFREFLLPEYRYCFENVLKAGKSWISIAAVGGCHCC